LNCASKTHDRTKEAEICGGIAVKIDYSVLLRGELTWDTDIRKILAFLSRVDVDIDTSVLIYGFDVEKYARVVEELTGNSSIVCFEFFSEMRQDGYCSIPLESDFFDFVYVLDADSFMPDLKTEFYRLLKKPSGSVTMPKELHYKYGTGFWSDCFPVTVSFIDLP